jgi:hypothetical protein
LIRPKDGVIVDTGKLKTISGMLKKMSETIEEKLKNKYGN